MWSEPGANVSIHSHSSHGITNNYERVSIIFKCGKLGGQYVGEIIEENLTIFWKFGV